MLLLGTIIKLQNKFKLHNHHEISLQTKPKHERGEEEGQLGESQGRGEGGETTVRDVFSTKRRKTR